MKQVGLAVVVAGTVLAAAWAGRVYGQGNEGSFRYNNPIRGLYSVTDGVAQAIASVPSGTNVVSVEVEVTNTAGMFFWLGTMTNATVSQGGVLSAGAGYGGAKAGIVTNIDAGATNATLGGYHVVGGAGSNGWKSIQIDGAVETRTLWGVADKAGTVASGCYIMESKRTGISP